MATLIHSCSAIIMLTYSWFGMATCEQEAGAGSSVRAAFWRLAVSHMYIQAVVVLSLMYEYQTHLSVCLSICLFVCLSVRLSVHLLFVWYIL